MAISKKSTFFVLSLWNMVKMINSWGGYFQQVSEDSTKNVNLLLLANFWVYLFFYSDFRNVIRFNLTANPLQLNCHFIHKNLCIFMLLFPSLWSLSNLELLEISFSLRISLVAAYYELILLSMERAPKAPCSQRRLTGYPWEFWPS